MEGEIKQNGIFETTLTSFTDLDILAYLEKIGLLIISSLPENPQHKIIIVEKQFVVEMDIFRILSY